MTAHDYSNAQNSMISFDYSWCLGKNLSNFVSLPWKLHNRYCHTSYLLTYPYFWSKLSSWSKMKALTEWTTIYSFFSTKCFEVTTLGRPKCAMCMFWIAHGRTCIQCLWKKLLTHPYCWSKLSSWSKRKAQTEWTTIK